MNLAEYAKSLVYEHKIDRSLYNKYNVKIGLRNKDGSGVLVGLTKVGDVHGYIKDEEEVVPVEGRLRYRSIDIEPIIEAIQAEKRMGFEEVAFLLLFGKLPTAVEQEKFNNMLDANRDLPEGFVENMILKAPSNNIMIKLARSILACYSYDKNPEALDVENVLRQSIELIARFPTMIAYGFQAKAHYYHDKSLVIHKPKNGLGTAKNFLRLIRHNRDFSDLEAQTLDICLILHAEHGGGNNSTFTVRVVTSSDTDTYSAISAAVGSLKGYKHGGANMKVIEMFEDIKKNVKDWSNEKEIREYILKILNKQAFDRSGLIYGLGHAVYTISDPRAVILKKYANDLAKEKNRSEEFNLYTLVEKIGIESFLELKGSSKKICANVDMYSGLVYNMLDIPPELYTPIFAMSRITGWCSHRIEELINGGKIIRPAYKNVSEKKEYIPLAKR